MRLGRGPEGPLYPSVVIAQFGIARYWQRGSVWEHRADTGAQFGHVLRQLVGTRWSFATPEGNAGWRTMRVFHQHASAIGLHAANAP